VNAPRFLFRPHRQHVDAAFPTNVLTFRGLCVCLCVGHDRPSAQQKRFNRSKCRSKRSCVEPPFTCGCTFAPPGGGWRIGWISLCGGSEAFCRLVNECASSAQHSLVGATNCYHRHSKHRPVVLAELVIQEPGAESTPAYTAVQPTHTAHNMTTHNSCNYVSGH